MLDAARTIKTTGRSFLTNTGNWFNVEKLSVPYILKTSVNPYYVIVKSRVTNQLFGNPPEYNIYNPNQEKDSKLSDIAKKMCENLIDLDTMMKTNMFLNAQTAFSDIFDYGASLFEPVWGPSNIAGINWQNLIALKHLPTDTFRLLPDGIDKTPSQIVKGIYIGVDGKVHYSQQQDDGKFYEIKNILHIKSPISRDLAGDALSWPVIPIIEMLNFMIDIRRMKGARVGAPSVFVEMLSDDDDTKAIAEDIIQNWGVTTQFAHSDKIRVYTISTDESPTVEDAIKSLETLLDSLYNPASMIQKDGTRLGGSDAGAERLIYAQANTFLSWLDLGFSSIIGKWLDINGFTDKGYTGIVWFPKLEVDKTLLDMQKANDGFTDQSLTRDERRVLRGFDVADDDTAAILDEEYSSMGAFMPGLVQNSNPIHNSNPPIKPNPAMPIVEKTAEELKSHSRKLETHIYSAMGIKSE